MITAIIIETVRRISVKAKSPIHDPIITIITGILTHKYDSDSDSGRWRIGLQGRRSGSIHSDSWQGTAAQLAECNLLAVFPVIGWWRQRTHLNKTNTRTRYSLVVTLETPVTDIELYAPVETMINNIIAVPIQVNDV